MRPDGSEQQPAPDAVRNSLDQLHAQQRWSPDGSSLLHVDVAPGRSDANIFIGQANSGGGQIMITDFDGDEFDPVWSPDNQWIAFVTTHTGNDELWSVRVDGSDARWLTRNDWEWDKHPSWSPDGSQLAFYSNRTGSSQIWVMDATGANQYNISNNQHEDWDPVWIR
jgi:Tol biopolymer transport system component